MRKINRAQGGSRGSARERKKNPTLAITLIVLITLIPKFPKK
jgi:hypothetical protein